MSDNDEYGAQKLAVMIVSMLVFATLCVIFSCYRICIEDRNRKKQQLLAPVETEPSRIYNIVNRTPQTSNLTATQQSDHQLIFGAASLNISTTTTEVLTRSINQEIVRQRPLTDLQNELERRAQERRDNLQRNAETDILEFCLVPPYNSKDESLPSYDQAVNTQDNDKNYSTTQQ